jgi:hypothetical protein
MKCGWTRIDADAVTLRSACSETRPAADGIRRRSVPVARWRRKHRVLSSNRWGRSACRAPDRLLDGRLGGVGTGTTRESSVYCVWRDRAASSSTCMESRGSRLRVAALRAHQSGYTNKGGLSVFPGSERAPASRCVGGRHHELHYGVFKVSGWTRTPAWTRFSFRCWSRPSGRRSLRVRAAQRDSIRVNPRQSAFIRVVFFACIRVYSRGTLRSMPPARNQR